MSDAAPESTEGFAPRAAAWRRTLVLTVALEVFTVFLRYGIGLQSTRDTASTLGSLTGGLRIHHGYLGIVMILLAFGLRKRAPRAAQNLMVWGSALALSDAAHHFLVLWPIEGDPEFHLWYGESR